MSVGGDASTKSAVGIAMIGGGQMALALAAGFVRSGLVGPDRITVFDPSEAARERLARAVPGIIFAEWAAGAVERADIVFVCVKPQQVAEAATTVCGRIPDAAVVVSIVAGLSLDQLGKRLGTRRVIRVMPNTPCLVGQGVSVVCKTPAVEPDQAATVRSLLEAVGTVHEVDESLMNAVTGVSGSGPGFLARFVEALTAGGVAAGLPADLAARLARETFCGTAALLAQTGEPPEEIRRRVTSPGGTTLAGLTTMDARGVPEGIAAAVVAASNRAAELSRSG